MSVSKEGIVLRATPYGESRIIVNLYTPEEGTIGLIATISKKGRSGLKKAHFQNLQILEVNHAEKSKGELKRLEEARIHYSYQNLYFDPIRSCLSLFLSEFLYKVLKDEDGDPDLYPFLKQSLISLDATQHNVANFHLVFLMELTAYLGFSPNLGLNDKPGYFDLMAGETLSSMPDHPHFIDPSEVALWQELQSKGIARWPEVDLRSNRLRRQALESLINYYRLQLNDFGTLKSLSILREVLA